MDIYFMDFETYYDAEYSLSKITTEEYIRDDRFEVIGVAVQKAGGQAQWFSGTHDETAAFLAQFPFEESMVVSHNAMFDATILGWRFDIHPKALGDTWSMANAWFPKGTRCSLAALAKQFKLPDKGTEVVKALGKRRLMFTAQEMADYAAYCRHDTWLCAEIFRLLMEEGFPAPELKVIDLTLRMFTKPVLQLDLPLLEQHLVQVRERKEKLLSATEVEKADLMSNPKFADILRGYGVEPPMKNSKTTGRPTYAFARTDVDFLALQDHEDERVQAVVAARLGTKSTLEETRTERFIHIAKRGKFPIPLTYSAAHTHRWGGSDKINLQNLPSRDRSKMALKRAIQAPRGYTLINADQSQIEARVLAWLAHQDDLVDEFAAQDAFVGPKSERPDVYKNMAGRIYGIDPRTVDAEQRFFGKTVTLGAGFGVSGATFRLHVLREGRDMSEEEAFRVITAYRDNNPKITAFWRECGTALDTMLMGGTSVLGRIGVLWVQGTSILMPSGLRIDYRNLRKEIRDTREVYLYDGKIPNTYTYGAKVTENVTQGVARCVVADHAPRLARRWSLVLTVHDSLVFLVPDAQVDRAVEDIYTTMRTTPRWAHGLPLNCEIAVGKNYGDMEVVK